MRVTPNSVLATTAFTNLSRPAGTHKLAMTMTFSVADPPDGVCARRRLVLLSGLPQLRADSVPPVGGAEYRTSIGLNSPADDGAARATFLRRIWYAARREGLHLDNSDDDYSTAERVEKAVRTVVAPAMRLNADEQRSLHSCAKLVRYGADEAAEYAGQVPKGMTSPGACS